MRRKGFSLVELLVVIAVVTLLAAFLLPSLSRAREYAYFTTCKSTLRQTCIGLLLYAGDNRGRFPGVDDECNGIDSSPWTRRIGSWTVLKYAPRRTPRLMRQVYDDYVPAGYSSLYGLDWEDNVQGKYIGRPRRKGKYLPVEALWDPIVVVRDWCYNFKNVSHDAYAGTEKGRDTAARRCKGIGYSLFVSSVGCAVNKTSHVAAHWGAEFPNGGSANCFNAEAPYRWATNSRSLNTSHKASAWLAACNIPGTDGFGGAVDYPPNCRKWISHFGARQGVAGIYRFNVAHIDGHVDDTVWRHRGVASNAAQAYVRWVEPYGYSIITQGGGGIKKTADFDGAFDDNL